MINNANPNTALLAQLLNRLAAEEQRAHEKMANPSYWRNVGQIELTAAHDIRQCLQQVPDTLSPAGYLAAVTTALEALVAAWRANSLDEDGYGVATVHSVIAVVPVQNGKA